MNAILMAKHAVAATEAVAPFVSAEVRERLAIAEVAILVDGMDDSTPAAVRIHRLQEGMAEVRFMLKGA